LTLSKAVLYPAALGAVCDLVPVIGLVSSTVRHDARSACGSTAAGGDRFNSFRCSKEMRLRCRHAKASVCYLWPSTGGRREMEDYSGRPCRDNGHSDGKPDHWLETTPPGARIWLKIVQAARRCARLPE
jgi:hypothetical protein